MSEQGRHYISAYYMSIEVWKTETQLAHVGAEILEFSLLFLTLLIVSFIYTVIYMNGKCRLFVPHLPHSVTHTFFCTSLENIQCSLKVFSFLSVEKILSKSSLIQACATPQPSPRKRKTDCTNICQLMSNQTKTRIPPLSVLALSLPFSHNYRLFPDSINYNICIPQFKIGIKASKIHLVPYQVRVGLFGSSTCLIVSLNNQY